MFTLPETEYIELGDFIDTGIADDSNIVEVRCVFSDESEITEEELMADIPYEIREKFRGCTEIFTAAQEGDENDMSNNCKGCFADNDRYGVGCTALKERIETNCPFYCEREKYMENQDFYRELLREKRPSVYAHYYGKEKSSAYR